MAVLTLKRCKEIQKTLETCDREIDSIIQEYYAPAGAQNIGGGIGSLSKLHAQLVQDLADKIRELEKLEKENKNKK
jgi:tetrahydromethanopterin S-methyltransferase subunit G